MGYTIAIAGKGGTGKTTLASLIARIIKEKQLGSVLIVDADPDSNLAQNLGIEVKETIGQILDSICTHPEQIPAGMPKERFIEYQIQTAIQETEGFDILTMGRPEGPGCYCYVNSVLRNIMQKLIKDYAYVIIDNEAGLEHLSRRTTRSCDALIVVSQASRTGLRSAKKINELVNELEIETKKRLLIINQCDKDIDKEFTEDLGLEYIGNIPYDNEIEKMNLSESSLLLLKADALSISSLRKIGDKIWH